MRKSFNLFVGTLKIKSEDMLRTVERQGRIPKLKIAEHYVIWWSRANQARYPSRNARRPAAEP